VHKGDADDDDDDDNNNNAPKSVALCSTNKHSMGPEVCYKDSRTWIKS